MAPSKSLSSLLLLLICGVAFAQAPGQQRVEMKPLLLDDPVDGHTFEWSIPVSTNGLGGFDSDGATYARGPQPRTTHVATSPTSLYSAPIDAFSRSLTDDQKASLLVMLTEVGENVDDARQLSPTERFELAAATAEHLGDPPFDIGEMYLGAAWTVRDTVVGFLPNVQGASDAWAKLQETIPLAREVQEPRGRTIALFDLARLSHRGGLPLERDAFLATLDTFPDAGVGGPEKRAEFLRRVARENELLKKARQWFHRGLESRSGTPQDRAYYRFLVGDLARRLGEWDEARTQLESVRLDKGATEAVRIQAEDVFNVLSVQATAEVTAPTGESK